MLHSTNDFQARASVRGDTTKGYSLRRTSKGYWGYGTNVRWHAHCALHPQYDVQSCSPRYRSFRNHPSGTIGYRWSIADQHFWVFGTEPALFVITKDLLIHGLTTYSQTIFETFQHVLQKVCFFGDPRQRNWFFILRRKRITYTYQFLHSDKTGFGVSKQSLIIPWKWKGT